MYVCNDPEWESAYGQTPKTGFKQNISQGRERERKVLHIDLINNQPSAQSIHKAQYSLEQQSIYSLIAKTQFMIISKVVFTSVCLSTNIFTACVQSTREGNVFTLFVRPQGGGAYGEGIPNSLVPGLSSQGLSRERGYPCLWFQVPFRNREEGTKLGSAHPDFVACTQNVTAKSIQTLWLCWGFRLWRMSEHTFSHWLRHMGEKLVGLALIRNK